jgi:hypothetical protein
MAQKTLAFNEAFYTRREFSVTNYQIVRFFARLPGSAKKVGVVLGMCHPAICLLRSGQSFVPSQMVS